MQANAALDIATIDLVIANKVLARSARSTPMAT